MKVIFVVDDNDTNLTRAKQALAQEYKVYTVPSAAKMLTLIKKVTPDLILLDIEMPEMDGFAALELLQADSRLAGIPVVFLTAKNDEATEIHGFERGAVDFVTKPFSAPVLRKRIEQHIQTDKIVKESTRSLREMQNAMISVIAELVEDRDAVTGMHIANTETYLAILLDELREEGLFQEELAQWDLDLFLPSCQLHDVGKISISDVILNKPGKLTDEEFDKIKTHTTEGERIIDQISLKTKNNEYLFHARLFAGAHHEKWNGTGYPRGLAGTDIPLHGRLMALADVYDALVSERPYKRAFSHAEAMAIIEKDSGSHFDPDLARVFVAAGDKIEAARKGE